jgi:hypothetical protein
LPIPPSRQLSIGEIKVAQGITSSGHDLLELLLLVFQAILLRAVALLAGVIPVGVVILVGGVKLLSPWTVSDKVGGVAALEAAPR